MPLRMFYAFRPNRLGGCCISILFRKLLKRSSFTSKDDLKTRLPAFIDYFNRTMAKPFKWTYKGKVLTV